MARFTPEEIALLEQYVSHPTGNVFAVFPKLHGIVGAAFARYSRAPGGFRETFLKEFVKAGIVDQKHAQILIERILIGFGDDSVGELEGSHLALESISNLATKEVEDSRIGGSPIEQSSRYVFYDQKDESGQYRYLRVPEIMAGPVDLVEEFIQTMDHIFNQYCRLINPLQQYFRKLKPIDEAHYDIRGDKHPVLLCDLSEDKEIRAFNVTYLADIRSKACDVLRVLLPACTLTNLGLFGNGRYFQHLLTRLCSSGEKIQEFADLARQGHVALNTVIPVYVKRAAKNSYRVETDNDIRQLTELVTGRVKPKKTAAVRLLDTSNPFVDWLLAVMLYKYAECPLDQLQQGVSELSGTVKEGIFSTYIGERRNRHDRPGRALEFGYPINFEIVADFGIYRDLQRERMKTQIRQLLTTNLGYTVSEEFEVIGELGTLRDCYERSAALYEKVRGVCGREVAQYVVLFGHNIRWYQGMNYREAMHELELRTIPQGHPSYRRVCQEMHRQLQQANPFLGKMFQFVDHQEYYWSRAESEARQRAKEARLES